MLDDPLAGRALRAPERSRMLVATKDGVFLWPGTPLVYRTGNGFFAAEPRAMNSAIGCLFGPAARQVLRWIADSGCPNQSLDAKMTIVNLDNGTFKPD